MGNITAHHRTPAHAPGRALLSTQPVSLQPDPPTQGQAVMLRASDPFRQTREAKSSQEAARVFGRASTARASQGARALSSKLAGKTQVGRPKPGVSAPITLNGAPGSGLLIGFLALAAVVAIVTMGWAVIG